MTDIIEIHRFDPRPQESPIELASGEVLGIFADVESTGTDPEKEEIVEVSLVPFAFTPDGRVTQMGKALVALEDPGRKIPAEATAIHGITTEMVARKRLPEAEINELVNGAGIVIAHKADFDRKMLEKRLPVFSHLRFGCSHDDIPWQDECGCGKLHCLMWKHCHLYYDAHRADVDCYAGVQLLGTTLPRHDGKRALSYVLDGARVSHIRVYATGSPFDYKDVLKGQGYFAEYKNGKFVAWYRDVIAGDEFMKEIDWLANNAMCHSPTWSQFDSRKRFSNRIGESVQRQKVA